MHHLSRKIRFIKVSDSDDDRRVIIVINLNCKYNRII